MSPEDPLRPGCPQGKGSTLSSEGVEPDIPPPTSPAAGGNEIDPPSFLHEKEVRDAVRAITLIASGRNPFSEQPFDKLRPEHRDSVLQALCVVVSAITHSTQLPMSSAESWSPSGSSAKSLGKRPLEEYLERVEREAILEALAEAKHNRTAAARLLGITFRALRYRMESLGLDKESE